MSNKNMFSDPFYIHMALSGPRFSRTFSLSWRTREIQLSSDTVYKLMPKNQSRDTPRRLPVWSEVLLSLESRPAVAEILKLEVPLLLYQKSINCFPTSTGQSSNSSAWNPKPTIICSGLFSLSSFTQPSASP